MKAKILQYKYTGENGFTPVRVYLESDFDTAEKDLKMMQEYASDLKNWKLTEVDMFGIHYTNVDPFEIKNPSVK